jgi:LuxR family maltose regulon positive regulatory protein
MHSHSGRAKTCGALMERLEAIGASEAALRSPRSRPLLALRLAMSRTYACIARQDFQSALRHVQVAAELAHRLQLRCEGITAQLLHALCRCRLGEAHEALLAEAVGLAELLGLKRIIRDAHPDIQAMIDTMRGNTTLPDAAARPTGHATAVAMPPPRGAAVQIMPSALLTPKEREVLRHLADGCPNKRIANILEISDETVKWHVKNLSAKFGGANRRHVVDRARQMGIIA